MSSSQNEGGFQRAEGEQKRSSLGKKTRLNVVVRSATTLSLANIVVGLSDGSRYPRVALHKVGG